MTKAVSDIKGTELFVDKPESRSQDIINGYVARATATELAITDILRNGAGFTPYDDMVLYVMVVTPKLTEDEMEGVDKKVLDMLFENDKEEDVTNQKLILIAKGERCVKEMLPGNRVAIRGHAFKITTPKGTFFTVREHDVIGRYDD